MELRPGYKQSEVGVIPEDWEVQSFAEACSKIQDGTHFSPSAGGVEYLYVTSKNIGFGALDLAGAGRIDAAQHKAIYKRCDVRRGDLLLTKDGASTGNAALNTLDEEFSLLSSVALLRFRPGRHDAGYWLQQVLSHPGQARIKGAMVGNAITRLTLDRIKRLRFPAAPYPEQRAIAAALGDVDALIASLEKLIAKKRDLKQAAMQQLLTGRTRLPGFREEWKTRMVEHLADIVGGATPSTKVPDFWDGDMRWCIPTDITGTPGKYLADTERTITQAGLDACSARLLPAGTLLLCSRATIGELKIAAVEVCTNQGFKSLVVRQGNSNEFLYYLLLTMKPRLQRMGVGSTFLEVSKKDIASVAVYVPMHDEQVAIAAVLSDMDAEIEALEKRLGKTRDLKQGMMQELLTGRTRLV